MLGFKNILRERPSQAISGTIELNGDYKLSNVLQDLTSNALYINDDLKFGGDSFAIMSPVKRALALLRVLIELDSKSAGPAGRRSR